MADYSSSLVAEDPTVSNKHVRIYSVLFEDHDGSDIPPLVYAEDLSLNGTYWNGVRMTKGNGGVLLGEGDELRISPRLTLGFYPADAVSHESVDEIQEAEKEVPAFIRYYLGTS